MTYVNSKPNLEKLSNNNDDDDDDDEDEEHLETSVPKKISLDINKLNITLFHAGWCGHCQKFIKETWTDLKEKYDNHNQVQLNEVDCTNIKSRITTPKGENIEGFPTLIINYLDKSDEIKEKEYNGGRSLKHLEEYIQNMLEDK
jgi:thiol-disulfide isomerase/thioredoxin